MCYYLNIFLATFFPHTHFSLTIFNSLKLSFSQEPVEISALGDFIYSKITILKNGQELAMRYANFSKYTNDNGITFMLDTDTGDIQLYARIVEREANGKLHLVHNPLLERVLYAHEHECLACSNYKSCPKSSYHSISVSSEKNELMLYLQVSLIPLPEAPNNSFHQFHLLISTADRSAFVLSPPFKIVEEITLSSNSMITTSVQFIFFNIYFTTTPFLTTPKDLQRKLVARHLRWLTDFLGAMLPDDDHAEDAWVALDNAITHKLRGRVLITCLISLKICNE